MRIGLISDTHIPEAQPVLYPQVFEAFKGVDYILHAGDCHDLSVIDQLGRVAPIYVARGNGDDGSGGRPVQPDDPRLRNAWVVELGGLKIGIHHDVPIPDWEGNRLPDAMMRIFGTTDLDVLVYGDTHVEAIDELHGVLCINPGSPTYPRNLNTQYGTIGFLDIDDDGKVEASIWMLTSTGIEPHDMHRWKRPW